MHEAFEFKSLRASSSSESDELHALELCSLGDVLMWRIATFVSAVVIMAALSLIVFLVEKADTGEEWAVMAIWFSLCDWLLPNSKVAPARQFDTPTVPTSLGAVVRGVQ